MAVEALQLNEGKAEEKSRPASKKTIEKVETMETTKAAVQEDPKAERYKKLLMKHRVPAEEEYSHKREQLYLMVGQDLTDAFIEKVISFPSQTIDRLRMTVFVTGEEFLQDRVKKDPPQEDQIRSWIDEFMKPSEAVAGAGPGGTSVEKSLDIMGRHMVRQQEIAGEQIHRLTEYLRRMNEMMQERSERDISAIREENQKEREQARKQIDLLSDENFRLSMKLEDAQEEAKKKEAEEKEHAATTHAAGAEYAVDAEYAAVGHAAGAQYAAAGHAADATHAAGADYAPGHFARDEGLFARRRRRKEQKQREAFIASALGSSDFSAEQLAVIRRVVEKNFTLSQLQKICDPQVKPENMELLEAYYERRSVHG